MQKIHELMKKEMTRKEFLGVLGFGAASLMGLGTILRFLGKENPLEQSPQAQASFSYGGGVYGGVKRT